MDKKDIYEHLAKIYLDAASLKRKKKPKDILSFRALFFISVIFIGLTILIFSNLYKYKNKSLNSEFALVLCPDVVKVNFNFDPAKKETYSVDLNNLDLNRFKTLGFSLKKANYQDIISLRVEFTSNFKEKSEIYLKDIPHKWQDYKIDFKEFKNITDWSSMQSLSFSVEEWNVRENRGVVYLDNVRFLR